MATRFLPAVLATVVGFTLTTVQAADDIETKAQVCVGCHGLSGGSADPKTIPPISGQQQSYLMKQLRDFRNGERRNALMSGIAGNLAEDDLRKLAAYFAAKPWPAKKASAKKASAKAPAAPKGIAQCQACHQPNFQGGEPAPRLAGMSSGYLLAQMRAFANEERTNNLDMPGFMKGLSEKERWAIARYLSAL